MSELPPPTYNERLDSVLLAARFQCIKDKVYWKDYSNELICRISLDFDVPLAKVLADYKECIWAYFNPYSNVPRYKESVNL